MINDVEKAIRDYLPDIIHMSLATSVGNQPWLCEVHYVYDDDLNFYFRSLESRRHSQEIERNPNVAGSIVTQHSTTDKPRGIFFTGKAEKMINVSDKDPAYLQYCKRFGTDSSILDEA